MDSIRCKSNIHENIERNTFMSKELQIRNSTVDFLVFTRDAGEDGIEVRVQNGDVWLTQKAISQLFDVDRSVITKHLSNIFKEGELDENSVCAKFAQTADDGKTYNYKFYSLAAIIAVGYRINSERATQFRTWATKVLDTFTKQGYVLDKSRLINGQIFDEDYFEHLIAEIQEIRASERRFYQKITDIYATAVDYDKNSQVTREFYATVQNKMHYAVHGNTAAEVIVGYENILEINHCREGRIEFESSEGECLYVKKGDMAINMKAGVKSYSYFPQSHYHGVTIEIDFDKIEKNQNMIMKEMQLSPKILQDKFCNHKQCIVLHEKQEFEHLFSEIYCVPEQIKKSYYKIKVMEILLFLFALDTTKEKIENRYFNKNLVAKVKEIHQYMLNHIDEKLTIACLADKHQISATNLKKYFKEIYGLSIYAYLKEKRIQKAAELLRETNHEIGKIAGMVGYDNASKFSNSFKSIMGINPSEYKKSV